MIHGRVPRRCEGSWPELWTGSRQPGNTARVLIACLGLWFGGSSGAAAQAAGAGQPPPPVPGVPVVLWEHGDPAVALLPGIGVVGLMVTDIVTAPASARRYNVRNSTDSKSGSAALAWSLGSTAAPIMVGALATRSSDRLGAALIFSGVVLGPSAGQWYAGEVGRGLLTAGLRFGLAAVAGAALLAAS